MRYAVTIFLGAFLLFQVQPMSARLLLPRFGGGPGVWTTCMLFFQAGLLGGYAYAHLLNRRFRPRMQAAVHVTLLVGASAALFLGTGLAEPTRAPDRIPVAGILALLVVMVGAPYFLLSATGPLLQRWFNRSEGRSPYRLYALSNTASLLALLSYPFIFEPLMSLHHQTVWWGAGFALFVVLSAFCAMRLVASGGGHDGADTARPAGSGHRAGLPSETPAPAVDEAAAPRPGLIFLWLGLAAVGSIMMLATTNQLSLEVAAVPFIWVLPLSLYLLTWVVAFSGPRGYDRRIHGPLFIVAVVAAIWMLGQGVDAGLRTSVAVYTLVMFEACLVCHGELARRKPHPRHLTAFYLWIAVGGALGGVIVAVVAPVVFQGGYWEYHLALAAACALVAAVWVLDRFGGGNARVLVLGGPTLVLLGVLFLRLLGMVSEQTAVLGSARNFFGVLRVEDGGDRNGRYLLLTHGGVAHGMEYLSDSLATYPTTYYGPESGIGRVFERLGRGLDAGVHEGPPLRVGVLGLGVGTLAAYTQPGDTIRFYEINPLVATLARRDFKFLADARGTVEIAIGDGRVLLDRELREGHRRDFDVLVIDAFSGATIPVHLLTVEAADVYWSHLKPGGVLAFHLSNHYFDLIRVARGLAEHLGCDCIVVSSFGEDDRGEYSSDWCLLTEAGWRFRDGPRDRKAAAEDGDGPPLTWTDDWASLWHVLQ
jgi:hypothetical protein